MIEDKKLEYKIKILRRKLKEAQKRLDQAYLDGFQEGFEQGQAYQLQEIELEMFRPDGEAH